MTANDFKQFENTPDFDHALTRAHFKRWIFTLKIAEDTYNDETRVKVTVQRVTPVDWVKESASKVDKINELLTSDAPGMAYGNEPKKARTAYGAYNAPPPAGYNNAW